MELVVLGAGLILAALFAVAGTAKLTDRDGSRRALADFGIPRRIARPLGLALPVVELAVALSLLVPASAWWGAVVAMALLFIFSAGISANLARGRRPTCRCFGQLHAAPVGWRTVARNAALALVAAIVVWQGRDGPIPSLTGWLAELTATQAMGVTGGAIVLGMLAAQGWLLLQLLRQQGRLLLRIDALEARLGDTVPRASINGAVAARHSGLPLGATAPAFELADLDGETTTLDHLRRGGKPIVLLFMDPNCGPCSALMPDVGRWQADHAADMVIAIISRGDARANRAKAAEHGVERILLQRDDEVADAYQAFGTPSAVLIRPDGTIGSPVAGGAEPVRSLIAHVFGSAGTQAWAPPLPIPTLNGHDHDHQRGHDHTHEHASSAAPKIGDRAPALMLPGLDGAPVDLADFWGGETLVLFWNPGCAFCQQMLPDLVAWEAELSEGAPTLLIVSTGQAEENRAMGLRSTIVLDQNFSVAPTFGANGTPMAVLVDAEGRIGSDLAAGAPAVLALVRAGQAQTVAAMT